MNHSLSHLQRGSRVILIRTRLKFLIGQLSPVVAFYALLHESA